MGHSESPSDLEKFLRPPNQWPTHDVYKPLDQRRKEIRLLNISCAPGTENIRATSQHLSLENAPEYDALSYCWGPPDERRAVEIDGESVLIRESLHKFLLALCRQKQSLPVWVDSLCINQKDVHERNWQVALMGEIYGSATNIRAWLGDADADSNYLFDFIKHRHDHRMRTTEFAARIENNVRRGYALLARRSYWTRLWVVQEIVLASKLYIMCGTRCAEWSEMIQTIKELSSSESEARARNWWAEVKDPGELSKPDLDEKTSSLGNLSIRQQTRMMGDLDAEMEMAYLESIQQLRESLHISKSMAENTQTSQDPAQGKQALIKLVRLHIGQACEDPRDKFYGMRAMARDGQRLPVDYKKSLLDVYFDMLALTLRETFQHEGFNEQFWADLTEDASLILENLPITRAELVSGLAKMEEPNLCQRLHPLPSTPDGAGSWSERRPSGTLKSFVHEEESFYVYPLSISPEDKRFRVVIGWTQDLRFAGIAYDVSEPKFETRSRSIDAINSLELQAPEPFMPWLEGELEACRLSRPSTADQPPELYLHWSRRALLSAIFRRDSSKWLHLQPLIEEVIQESHSEPDLCQCEPA